MPEEKSAWRPDKDAAIKALIRQTLDEAGVADPSALPHRLRERLAAQISGDADLDALIKDVLREQAPTKRA